MLGETLQYDRIAIAAGELHRLVTCHFVHWNADHFVWDAAVFVTLGLVAWRMDRRKTIGTLAAAIVMIPCAIGLLMPAMATYRGLSGLDSALFALVAAMIGRRAYHGGERGLLAAAVVAGACFAGKTAFELATGQTLFVDSATAGFVPVPLAHAVGAAAGVAIALVDPPAWRRSASRARFAG